VWRERRARFGELVQWDTSDHDWLQGRGERLYLIHMIDDATSRLRARFVQHDSTEENLGMLRGWIAQHGRMLDRVFRFDQGAAGFSGDQRAKSADFFLHDRRKATDPGRPIARRGRLALHLDYRDAVIPARSTTSSC
jgi:hypothetical protein